MAEAVHILILGEVTKFLNLSEFPKYCSDFPQVAKYSRNCRTILSEDTHFLNFS